MEIDRIIVKAISADSRMNVLKSLTKRKKMPSELSKEIGISPSTVVGHLRNLETAGLIKRVETGHKWVYYELTDKGSNIVRPRIPMQFALTIAIGLAMASFGFLKLAPGKIMYGTQKSAASEAIQTAVSSTQTGAPAAGSFAQSLPIDWAAVIVFAAGIALMIFGAYKIMRKEQIYI